jgi:NH3-dependent NAD+ synthetase
MISPDDKERALRDTLASLDSVIVAYSGGVDSAYLAYIASRTLGDRAVAVTADSPSYPERHRELAIRIARNTAPTPRTAAITASTSCTRTSRASPSRGTRLSSTATMPTIAATIVPAARRHASSASGARSTTSI